MKKILVTLLALLLVFTVGCAKPSEPDAGRNYENVETETKTLDITSEEDYANYLAEEFKDELAAMPLINNDGGIDYFLYTEDELYAMLGGEGLPYDELGYDNYFPSFDDSAMREAYAEIGLEYKDKEVIKFAEGPCEPDGFVIAQLDPQTAAELDAATAEMGDYEDYAAELAELEQQRKEAEEALQNAGYDEAMQALEDAKKELEAMGIDFDIDFNSLFP